MLTIPLKGTALEGVYFDCLPPPLTTTAELDVDVLASEAAEELKNAPARIDDLLADNPTYQELVRHKPIWPAPDTHIGVSVSFMAACTFDMTIFGKGVV